jgi:hypothetical protein
VKRTHGSMDYLKFMPVVLRDQHRGRLHLCPVCGKKCWTVWGRANKHWMGHGKKAGARMVRQHDRKAGKK